MWVYAHPVTPLHSTTSDPEVAGTVRLLHRRRGWIWTAVIGVVAWLVTLGLIGSLAPNASGAGAAFAAIFVLLLTIAVVVAVVAAVVDTVRLHRLDPGMRSRAKGHTAHHPVRAHAYRYPPRHRGSWVFAWIVMVILFGLGIAVLPGFVDGVAYLAGAENTATFVPASYGQQCSRSGCSTITNGYLATSDGGVGAPVTWPGDVPLGQSFQVHEPLWDWGFGSQLIDGDGSAIGSIIAGVLLDGAAALVTFAAVKLTMNMVRHRRAAASGVAV